MTTSVSSSTSSSSSSSSSSDSVSSNSTTSSSDLNVEFIDLLVAEIENQDPTNPLDASQYVSQLSQLSMVQSLTSLESTSTTTNDDLSNLSLISASNMVGKEVTVKASSETLDATGSVSGQVTLDNAADSVTVNLYNSSGTLVDQQTWSSEASGSTLSFDFSDLDAGAYTIKATSTVSGTSSSLTTYLNQTVDKVSLSDSAIQLDVDGIGTVALSDVLTVAND
jgi:flagellar basal-body rod modification protein FlgD